MSIKQLSIRSYFASPTSASPTPASASASASASAPAPAPASPTTTSASDSALTPAPAPAPAPASVSVSVSAPALSPAAASSPAPASPALPPPASSCIPREASIRPVKADDVSALRRINSLLLQVSYPETFYASAIDNPLCRVVTYTHPGQPPKIVGGIVCRDEDGPAGIYIRSLAVLSPYRGMGLAASALEDIARGEGRGTKLTAHVWTENEDALRWYEARGFRKDGPVISGYYLKLRPDSAWLMTRDAAAATRPTMPAAPATSFQNQRPQTEWNDLPDDMAPPPPLLLARSSPASSPGSSRSSSTAAGPRKKKDRAYPAAAFGTS